MPVAQNEMAYGLHRRFTMDILDSIPKLEAAQLSIFEEVMKPLDVEKFTASSDERKAEIVVDMMEYSPVILWETHPHLLTDIPEDTYPPSSELPKWNKDVLMNLDEMLLRMLRNILENYTELNKQ